jgi:hypothetical protein
VELPDGFCCYKNLILKLFTNWVDSIFLPNHMSTINHREPTKGINDQLLHVHLFNVGID